MGRITTPPDSKITWEGCTVCVRVCMLFRFSQEVLISTLVSFIQDNAEEGSASKI